MPAMMMSETPFPIPRLVICSPSHGAADQRYHCGNAEQHARLHDCGHTLAGTPAFQPDSNEVALDRRQQHRAITGILVELLTAALPLLLDRRQGRRERGSELDDNRRGNVRHHPERDQAHPVQRTAGERVEKIEHAAARGRKQAGKRAGIDSRQRHMAEQPKYDQCADGEPQPLFKVGRLGEVGEAYISGHLFGGGCHGLSIPKMMMAAGCPLAPRRLHIVP
jgi:hypothetical protein